MTDLFPCIWLPFNLFWGTVPSLVHGGGGSLLQLYISCFTVACKDAQCQRYEGRYMLAAPDMTPTIKAGNTMRVIVAIAGEGMEEGLEESIEEGLKGVPMKGSDRIGLGSRL